MKEPCILVRGVFGRDCAVCHVPCPVHNNISSHIWIEHIALSAALWNMDLAQVMDADSRTWYQCTECYLQCHVINSMMSHARIEHTAFYTALWHMNAHSWTQCHCALCHMAITVHHDIRSHIWIQHRADSTSPWNMDGSQVMNAPCRASKMLTKWLQNMSNRDRPKVAKKKRTYLKLLIKQPVKFCFFQPCKS